MNNTMGYIDREIEKIVLKGIKTVPWWSVVIPYLVVVASIAHLTTNWHWLGLFFVLFTFLLIYWALRLAILRLEEALNLIKFYEARK